MEIQYFGDSCFRIKSSKIILLINPLGDESKLKMPKTSADVVIFSHLQTGKDSLSRVEKTIRREPLLISGPGEYEIEGVFIFGLATDFDRREENIRIKNTAYTISLEGVRLAHLGNCNSKFNDEQLEEINGVDILFIPVGGNGVLTSEAAGEVINQIEPKMIIPMIYQQPGQGSKRSSVNEFLSDFGVEVKPIPKLIISKENLSEEREVVVLESK